MDRASLRKIDVSEGHREHAGHAVGTRSPTESSSTRVRQELLEIEGTRAEFNQVWTNLIDNAIDAMDGEGTLRVATRVEATTIVVEIGDFGGGNVARGPGPRRSSRSSPPRTSAREPDSASTSRAGSSSIVTAARSRSTRNPARRPPPSACPSHILDAQTRWLRYHRARGVLGCRSSANPRTHP